MSALLKPCVVCGELADGPRCPEHTIDSKPSRHVRGYDSKWSRLSARARRLQPFCTFCGTTEDLTTDHSPEAWERREAGLPIRLEDVRVLCRPCNSKAGRARPWGDGANEGSPVPPDKAQLGSLLTSRDRGQS